MAAGKTLAVGEQALAADMNTIGQWGLAANIPATGDVVAGSFYYETDTKLLKQEQNGVWVDISGADLSTTTAVVGDVKAGKTFFAVEKPIKTGTLATRTLNPANETVLDGYYEATTLSAVDADLAVGNIKQGTTIFGFAGTVVPAGTETLEKYADAALAQFETYTPAASGIFYVQGYLAMQMPFQYYSTGNTDWYFTENNDYYAGSGIGNGSQMRVRAKNAGEYILFRQHYTLGTYERYYDDDIPATSSYTPAAGGIFAHGDEAGSVYAQVNFTTNGWYQADDIAQPGVITVSILIGDGTNLRFYNSAGEALRVVVMRAILSI